jgi:hypothetical protein
MYISEISKSLPAIVLAGFFFLAASAVGEAETGKVEGLPKQPLVVQVESLEEALRFLGRPIIEADQAKLQKASALPDAEAVDSIQHILDPYTLVIIDIDPNRKVTVTPASGAENRLTKNGWTTFLVKVINRAHSTDPLSVDSPEAAMPYDFSRMQVERSIYEDQFAEVMFEKHFHIGTTWGSWGAGYPYKEAPQPELQNVTFHSFRLKIDGQR